LFLSPHAQPVIIRPISDPHTNTAPAAAAAAMKRGNERSQLSKDENERETEEEGYIGSGTFRKADER